MKEDISKSTVLVLVVLTILISLLGTWTVSQEVQKMGVNIPGTGSQEEPTASGRVSLAIVPPQRAGATGQVALEIVNT